MISRLLVLFIAACLMGAARPVRAQTSVEVVVSSRAFALPGASVRLWTLPDSSRSLYATADTSGRAVIAELPAGRYRVRVESPGYAMYERNHVIAAVGVTRIVVALLEEAVELPGLTIQTDRRRVRFEESAGASVTELSQADVKMLPALGEADVLRAIEVLPGVVSTSDFSSSYNVRGGGADQNLILLDGLPIYNPFHLGGLFSVFNADMVNRTELFSGGFPAQYGGRVSSVLNVESQARGAGDGTGLDIQGGVSLLATRVAAGVDLPKALLNGTGLASGRARLSVRRSYFDQLLKPAFEFPYHLTDVQLFSEAVSSNGTRVTMTGYSGRDVLDLAGVDSFPLKVRWQWGNDVIGGTITKPVGGGRVLETRAGYTRFRTDIRFPEFGDTEFSSRIDQALLRAELSGRRSSVSWRTGASADWLSYDNLAQSGGTVFGQGNDSGWMLGTFAQQSLRTGPLLVETGLRVDAWLPKSSGALASLQPRLALKYFAGDSENVAFKLAAGRYAQFAHSLRDEELPLGIDIWVLSGDRAPVTVSDQVQGGIEAYLPKQWYAQVEGYYRLFDGVAANNPAEDPNDLRDDLLRGTGLSYGADVQVRRDGGRVRPMLAVSWLKATREFDDVGVDPNDPPKLRYAPIFDRRLDVDLVVLAMLPREWMLSFRWNVGTGLPYTRPVGSYVVYDYSVLRSRLSGPARGSDTATAVVLGERNAERYPVYHRLDAGVRRTFKKSWGTLTPSFDLLNVYDKRNVLFYFFEYDRSPATRSGVSMFPLLPTIGVEVRF